MISRCPHKRSAIKHPAFSSTIIDKGHSQAGAFCFLKDGTGPRRGTGPCRVPLPLLSQGQAEEPLPLRDPGGAQRARAAAPGIQATSSPAAGGSVCSPSAGSPGGQVPSCWGFSCGVRHPRRGERDSSRKGGSSGDSWGCRLTPPEQGGTGGACWRSFPPLAARGAASPAQKGTSSYLLSSSSASPGLSKGSCPSVTISGPETAAAIPSRGRCRAPQGRDPPPTLPGRPARPPEGACAAPALPPLVGAAGRARGPPRPPAPAATATTQPPGRETGRERRALVTRRGRGQQPPTGLS